MRSAHNWTHLSVTMWLGARCIPLQLAESLSAGLQLANSWQGSQKVEVSKSPCMFPGGCVCPVHGCRAQLPVLIRNDHVLLTVRSPIESVLSQIAGH